VPASQSSCTFACKFYAFVRFDPQLQVDEAAADKAQPAPAKKGRKKAVADEPVVSVSKVPHTVSVQVNYVRPVLI